VTAVDIAVVSIWAAFWLYWLVAAVHAKAGRSQAPRYLGSRAAMVVVIVLLLRLRAFRTHVIVNEPWLTAIGMVLFLGGLALAIWARRYLGRNWGTPMSQKEDPDLVTTGPYRKVRHPIYTGIITALIGSGLAASLSWLLVAAVLGGYFIVSATREERYMTALFPDAYPAYKRSTKMLLPYIL